MQGGLTSWALLTATAGLLAFLVGVYTLVGRDRKSPYLINSVFAIFLLCMVGAAIDIGAQISPWYQRELLVAGAVTLLIAMAVTIWRLWTIYVRFAYFIDPGSVGRLKFLPGIRQVRGWLKRSNGPSYEFNPVPLGQDLQKEIAAIIAQGASPEVAEGAVAPIVHVRDERDP